MGNSRRNYNETKSVIDSDLDIILANAFVHELVINVVSGLL